MIKSDFQVYIPKAIIYAKDGIEGSTEYWRTLGISIYCITGPKDWCFYNDKNTPKRSFTMTLWSKSKFKIRS